MTKKIKRFFVFVLFSLFFTMIGSKKEVASESKSGTAVSAQKSSLPLTLGGSTAEARGWTCY